MHFTLGTGENSCASAVGSDFSDILVYNKGMKRAILLAFFLFFPSTSWAFVPHSYPGIYIHQMGHVFFIGSCLFVIRTIIRNRLQQEGGWRYLLYSQIGFILWNIDTFSGHMAAYWVEPSRIVGTAWGWDYFKAVPAKCFPNWRCASSRNSSAVQMVDPSTSCLSNRSS